MTNEFLHFEKISRQTWQSLHRKTTPPLTEEELESIKSFNDQISLQDVTDIYLPLAHLIQIYKRSKERPGIFLKAFFLQRESKTQPFIIGVSGECGCWKIYYKPSFTNIAFTYRSRSYSRVSYN